jgi:uncharacterized membrane protein YgdD (TMEM256/DUF423 family)
MKNKWLFIAGLSGLLCVAIGAFAAHGLSKVLEPKELAWIETGVRYQMFHTIAILAIGILQLCRESLVTNAPTKIEMPIFQFKNELRSGSWIFPDTNGASTPIVKMTIPIFIPYCSSMGMYLDNKVCCMINSTAAEMVIALF